MLRLTLLRSVVLLTLWMAATAPISSAQPGYTDPAVCAGCHAGIAASYARTGMARSFQAVTPHMPLPEFNGSSLLHSASRESFRFIRRDGVPYIHRSQPGPRGAETNVFEERVDYVIGAGDEAISYLHRTHDNKLTEGPVSWYPENGGHWDMSPAYNRPEHPGFSREANYACVVCHNAYPGSSPAGESPAETIFPERLPNGIDCQRCHGPGQKHVEAATQGRSGEAIRTSIVNPERLSPARRSEVCLRCHLETTSSRLPASLMRIGRGIFSYKPGEPLGDFMLSFDKEDGPADSYELVSAPYRLAKSACAKADGNPLTCTTCHDPHVALSREESVKKTDGVCASCHQAAIAKLAAAGRHTAQQDCVTCHMPQRRTEDVIHAVTTDHWISKPHDHAAPAVEVNARNTAPYAGEVKLYYPKVLEQTTNDALSLAIAQAQSNPLASLEQLSRIAASYRSAPPEIAAEIGHGFLSLEQPQKAMAWYQNATEQSPGNWSYLSGLGNAQQAIGRPDLAAETFAKVALLAPWETDVLFSLGQSYARLGRLPDALRVLRQAANRNPENAVAFNDIGSVLLQIAGSQTASAAESTLRDAEAALREAVRIQPEFASLRMNLADALVRENKFADAQEQLEEAIRIGGRSETAEVAWFAALLASGDPAQALKAWKASFTLQVAGAHNNLGTVFASENRPDDALREYRLAVAADPQSALAQFNLGLTLFDRGLKSEAIPPLQKAAASANPGIRAAAKSLLERQ